MKRYTLQLMQLLAVNAWVAVAATTFLIETYYDGTACDGTPYIVNANEDSNCSTQTCRTNDDNTTTVAVGMVSVECTSDYMAALRDKFGSSPYIIQAKHLDSECTTFEKASGFPASGNCEGSFNANDSMGIHLVGTLQANGSATMQYYSGSPCLSSQWVLTEAVDKVKLENHSCDANKYRWYSSNDDESSSSSSLSLGDVVGIVAGGLVAIGIVSVLVFHKRRSKTLLTQRSLPLTTAILESDNTVFTEEVPRGRSGLWEDDVITARRVARDKIRVKELISRGAYGEVYSGTFNRQKVAVKMLLPATRGSLHQVNEFLSEAKMTATLDHPRIVRFIGIAWDSLSDLCVVLEFMGGGDLRTLLDKYLASKRPVGFNRQKTSIALQVCHALTYLHSLSPPVIHRDLKSRNILLNKAMEAKLTDFGISREHLDQTMTAGVGTSLWIAPEVMLGDKYDDKADMFSFGVVLSELDVHTLPYARVKKESLATDGCSMADTTLLQKVICGAVRVEFSAAGPRSIVELGQSCVSLNPSDRPSAAEALYQLHVLLSDELA